MRKIVLVGDQEYELGTNGYTPIAYKQQFGKDYFQDLFSMLKNQSFMNELNKLETDKELTATNIDISMLSDFDMTFFNRLFGPLLNLKILTSSLMNNSSWKWKSFRFRKLGLY